MSLDNIRNQSAYGVGQPLIGVPSAPITSDRNPTTSDKAQLGQLWINPTTNTAFILVSIVNNLATWGTYSTPIVGNLVVAGSVTAGNGFIGLAGGANITGASIFHDDVTFDGDIDLPAGNITANAGIIKAFEFDTITDPTKGVSMWENYVYAIGTNPDVDVIVVPQGTDGEFVIDGLWGGVLLSQWRTFQASVQTVDATQTPLSSVILGDSEMIVMKSVINGFKSTYDHALSGDIMISAFRPAGGNITVIGAKVVTSYIDGTASPGIQVDADVDVPTQSVRLLVTGAAGETWNFVTTTSYMYTTHP